MRSFTSITLVAGLALLAISSTSATTTYDQQKLTPIRKRGVSMKTTVNKREDLDLSFCYADNATEECCNQCEDTDFEEQAELDQCFKECDPSSQGATAEGGQGATAEGVQGATADGGQGATADGGQGATAEGGSELPAGSEN